MADENERQDDRNEETVPLTTVELRDTHRASTPETTVVSFFNETIAAMPRPITPPLPPPPPAPPAPPAPPVVSPAAN